MITDKILTLRLWIKTTFMNMQTLGHVNMKACAVDVRMARYTSQIQAVLSLPLLNSRLDLLIYGSTIGAVIYTP